MCCVLAPLTLVKVFDHLKSSLTLDLLHFSSLTLRFEIDCGTYLLTMHGSETIVTTDHFQNFLTCVLTAVEGTSTYVAYGLHPIVHILILMTLGKSRNSL